MLRTRSATADPFACAEPLVRMFAGPWADGLDKSSPVVAGNQYTPFQWPPGRQLRGYGRVTRSRCLCQALGIPLVNSWGIERNELSLDSLPGRVIHVAALP